MAKKQTTTTGARGSAMQDATASRRRIDPDDVQLVDAPIQVHSPVAGSPKVEDDGLTAPQRQIEKARRQYGTVITSERRLRADMREDRRFRIGKIGDKHYQWPEQIAIDRTRDRRPLLTINRTAGFVDMARNAGDAANLRIKVNPVDDKADPKVANVLAGLIRNTETLSFADEVYSTAGDSQCEMGRGYFWILTEYENDDSFRLRARLLRILNPLRVKVDTSAQEKDQSDAEFSFYDTDIDEDTWKDLYGKGDDGEPREVPTTGSVSWAEGEDSATWFPSGRRISIKHWFCAEYEPDTLYELKDGRTMREAALKAEVERLANVAAKKAADTDQNFDLSDEAMAEALNQFKKTQVKRKRPLTVRVIKWRVIDAMYVHAETTWPTPWQPFVPMVGDESDDDGERDLKGVVRDIKDSQKAYNIQVSSNAEFVNDMPKAPYIGYRGVFGKANTALNTAWKTSSTKKTAYLEAEIVEGPNGAALPVPQRNYPSVPLNAVNVAIQQSDNDMKATARVHDASLGEAGPQESGTAIIARQRQDELSNSHFTRNRRYALASTGRQLIRIFRTIYDVATITRIVGPDDKKEKVMVYSGAENDPRREENWDTDPRTGEPIPFKLPEGVKEVFDIGTGEFDVEVSAAPAPGSRRQEEVSLMSDFVRILPPQYMVNFMDLLFKLLDTPVGREMSERADKLLPPGLRDQRDGDGGGPQMPPEAMHQMEQMRQKGQELVAALKEAQETIRNKRMELASREQIEGMKRYVELVKLLVTEGNADRRLLLTTEVDRIHKFLESAEQRISQAESAQQNEEDQATAALASSGAAAAAPAPAPAAGGVGV